MKYRLGQLGFTMVELLVTLTIVAILAVVAIPTYLKYVRTAAFHDAANYAEQLKMQVAKCIILNNGDNTVCNQGTNGINTDTAAIPGTQVDLATVFNGQIYVRSSSQHALVIVPAYDAVTGRVTWDCFDSAVTEGLHPGC